MSDRDGHTRRSSVEAEERGILDTCDSLCNELLADGVGVSLGGGSRIGTAVVHVSDRLGAALEELHFVLGEGPALTCSVTGRAVHVPDLDAPAEWGRWPGFAPEASRAGAASLLAVPLWTGSVLLGTVTFHRRRRQALTVTGAVGALTAELARRISSTYLPGTGRTGWSECRLPEHRPDVHVAAGMLSVQWGVAADQALSRLCAMAFVEQSTVQQVARDIVSRRRTVRVDQDATGC